MSFLTDFRELVLENKKIFYVHALSVVFFFALAFSLIEGFSLMRFLFNFVELSLAVLFVNWAFGGYEGAKRRHLKAKQDLERI